MKLNSVLSFVVAFLALTACEKSVISRGYVLNPEDFSKIVIGKDNAQSVFDKVGSPTITSSVVSEGGGYSWYYISKKTEKNGFLDPKVTEQNTMIVSFNSADVVCSVRESKLEKDIKIVDSKTETEGKGAGILGETFGGLGKYMKRYKD